MERNKWSIFLLPQNNDRRGEGGLRTRGSFKGSQKDKPLISIITVVLNGGSVLEETIRSVLRQRYYEIEHIIIDGGSTDETVKILEKHNQEIDYWVSEPDNGLYHAMNKGWSLAHPESRILFLGAGDKILELPRDWSELRNHEIVYGRVQIGQWRIFESSVGAKLRFANTLHHQALLIPKILHADPPFNTSYKVYSDFDFNQRLLKQGAHFRFAENFLTYALPGGTSKHYSIEAYHIAKKNFGMIFGFLAFMFYVYERLKGSQHFG
ncbi:MAG: glycosyltransferase family 2 protein [Candidatus Hodarchaeota archaeon]